MRYCLLMHYQEGPDAGLTVEDMAPANGGLPAICRRPVGRRSADRHRGARIRRRHHHRHRPAVASPRSRTGPFADTKEKLGGIFVIEVDNLDEALKWAQRNPANGWGFDRNPPRWAADIRR